MNTELSPQIKEIKNIQNDLFEAAKEIRKVVFIQEQNVSEKEEFDAFEQESRHYLIYHQGLPIGTARWRFIESKIKLERFAILKAYRSKSFGTKLLKHILSELLSLKKTIYLHAQLPAISFYEKSGFKKVGTKFLECDIEHYEMIYDAEGQ